MRIVFMGTPDFAVPALAALAEGGHEIAAVVTQPDKQKGRGKAVQMKVRRWYLREISNRLTNLIWIVSPMVWYT